MKKQAKYHSDLTDAQYRVWEMILKEKQMDLGWQDGRKFISRFDGSMKVAGGAKILPKTMQAIEKAGLIKFDPYPHHSYFRLTEFGRDELTATGRAELAADAGERPVLGEELVHRIDRAMLNAHAAILDEVDDLLGVVIDGDTAEAVRGLQAQLARAEAELVELSAKNAKLIQLIKDGLCNATPAVVAVGLYQQLRALAGENDDG